MFEVISRGPRYYGVRIRSMDLVSCAFVLVSGFSCDAATFVENEFSLRGRKGSVRLGSA